MKKIDVIYYKREIEVKYKLAREEYNLQEQRDPAEGSWIYKVCVQEKLDPTRKQSGQT